MQASKVYYRCYLVSQPSSQKGVASTYDTWTFRTLSKGVNSEAPFGKTPTSRTSVVILKYFILIFKGLGKVFYSC